MNSLRDDTSRLVIELCTLQELNSFRELMSKFVVTPSAVPTRKRKALRGMLFISCMNGGAPWEYPLISQLLPGCWTACCELYHQYSDGQEVLDELGVK